MAEQKGSAGGLTEQIVPLRIVSYYSVPGSNRSRRRVYLLLRIPPCSMSHLRVIYLDSHPPENWHSTIAD
jgi:hypothetical protein